VGQLSILDTAEIRPSLSLFNIETIKETYKPVRPELVKKWPKSMLAIPFIIIIIIVFNSINVCACMYVTMMEVCI
jgi:hypothetical protein